MSKQVRNRIKRTLLTVKIERSSAIPGVAYAWLERKDGERFGDALWGAVTDLDGLRARLLNLNSVIPGDLE